MGSESRIWEIRPFGSMRGGSAVVIGLGPFNPSAPAYSTKQRIDPISVCAVISLAWRPGRSLRAGQMHEGFAGNLGEPKASLEHNTGSKG